MNEPYFQLMKKVYNNRVPDAAGKRNWIKNLFDKKLLFVRSSELSLRQAVQQSEYILIPNEIVNDSFSQNNIMSISKENIYQEYIISCESKKQILKELRMLGISQRTLFPDSIDLVREDIRKHREEFVRAV